MPDTDIQQLAPTTPVDEKTTPAPTVEPKPTRPMPPNKPVSRQNQVITLLRRKRGASLAELMEATGWQAHSVRGAISGTLKKKLGLPVTSERQGTRGLVYRIPTEA